MFVYGKVGTKAPYAISVLTLFKLTEILENKFSKEVQKTNKNFLLSIELIQKNILSIFLMVNKDLA